MKRVRYSVAMSLDGFIAGPNGEYDWIPRDPDYDFTALFAQFDTLLIGRKTYELTCRPGAPPMPGMDIYVFSRTLRSDDCPGVTVSAAPRETIQQIKACPTTDKDIWLFGGAALFASLLELNLVDTVEVVVAPVILGGGIPLLTGRSSRTCLRLTNSKAYPKSGIVRLEYAVISSR